MNKKFKLRKSTQPTKASQKKRVEVKKKRGELKKSRQKEKIYQVWEKKYFPHKFYWKHMINLISFWFIEFK